MSHRVLSLSRTSLFALAGLTAAAPAVAADQVMEDVVVSAPPVEGVPQMRAGSAVTEITWAEIEDRQIRRLEDALTLSPGVTISGQRGLGLNRAIVLRGLGPRNVRVFIDGIEMSDTSQSQSQYPVSELNMADVARIEVLRGPQPGRFGPDTGGGVISIITKRPDAALSGEASAEYGSYDTARARAAVSGVQGPVDFRLSASGTRSDGYSDFNEDRGGEEGDPYRQWSGAATLGFEVTEDLRLEAIGRYQREDVFYDASTADNDWNRDETERFLRLSATLDTLNDRLTHTAGISDTKITRQFWGQGTAGDTYDGYKTRIDYLATWRASDRVTVQAGADATRERMEQFTPGFSPANPRMESEFWRTGLFGTLGVTPMEGLDLSATLRGDEHEEFGSGATWRLAAAYHVEPTATTLRASYGTAWQTPSLYERFDPCYGRADLQPENSRGWDVGVDQDLWSGVMTASATYFQSATEDQIDWLYAPPVSAGCNGGRYVNIDETRVQGLEVSMTARPRPTVDASVSYTWQNAVDATTDLRLRNVPMHQATAAITWRFLSEAQATLSLRYRDETKNSFSGAESDEFWTADIALRYALTETVSLHGRIENLFDQSYEEEVGYGTPDRSAYAGLTVTF
ncbi:TonB-dependent receptor protein [Caenispirillum salinarum AK4]|uniref:TonB-dependent receptor protein n=1 Tax=Caenispirillum salinarum AK4 TaxID=1238182 RepID=K9GYD4_9PROT|nr:TonB-dependent receptor [Caenispirillum salinarum]EKV29774.1 TonB-dependent receptor protein [Caenispirillum salinarum AK4]